MTATALDEANGVSSFWQGIKTVLCCSRCKGWGTRCQVQFESAEYLSAEDDGPGQSPRAKYSCSGNSYNSRPTILSSTDFLIFPMLGRLSKDMSIDDVDKRRPMVVSSHRAPQICPKIELPAQRTDERMLEVPSVIITQKSKKYGEYWTPNCKQKANWDSFFESQSSMMLPPAKFSSEGNFDAADWGESDEYTSLPEVPSSREQSESGNVSSKRSSCPDLSRRRGEVLVAYVTAKGMRYTFVPLDYRLGKVSVWLNQGSALPIPISEHVHPKLRRNKNKNPSEFLNLTLAELFGDRLDPERDGITFFIGPIDGRVSFKMSLCELKALEKATKEIQSKEYPIQNNNSRSQLLIVS